MPTASPEVNPKPDDSRPNPTLKTMLITRSVRAWRAVFRVIGAIAMTSIFSSTVAKVSPGSSRRSGAGDIGLTTTKTSKQITNMRMAKETGQVTEPDV